MKLTANDARTYLAMMEGREHAETRNQRIAEFLKHPHCEARTIVISLNILDADYFDGLYNEDATLNEEERDLCRRMAKEYYDYAAAKARALAKKAQVVEPQPVKLPEKVDIKKGDMVKLKADGTEHEVIKGTKKPDGKIKVKTDDGQITVTLDEIIR